MFYINGFKDNLSTLAVLSKSAQPKARLQSLIELKSAYNFYLSRFQPDFTLTQNAVPETVADQKQAMNLIALFGKKTTLNDMRQETVIAGCSIPDDSIYGRVLDAIQQVTQTDENLGMLLKLTINVLFCAPSDRAGGGSSSGAIGCIWLNPRPSWNEQDYCEFLVHELTHQLVFLDELRFGHYPDYDQIEKRENFAFSTILNRQRPLDKVVHSLIVAIEVLRFRKIHFGLAGKTYLHPATEPILESLRKTIDSLHNLPRSIMSERVWNLIEKVENDGKIHFAI